ncbi:non-canonical purine NTP pyrophosphatase [Sulfurovum sp. bin170]|uniref:non-canonical purine NTP pyrophosphatase n=1 Tax=Sulfurovum sp. bin170 TaxID=2695268 RepID=UPI0013DF4BC6|nr:non-canonical purine NTP pyrophosphatase [Sulfurovum sp. bin170]NEW59945.1 non-canonical purine NTP pyrophosphatase [Sulfurovum sp. bin170]
MKIVLATGNKGKLREFREMFRCEVTPFSELLGEIDIVEDSDSFKGNALIKAKTIYEKLGEEYIVISDDSGISVPLLGGEPDIYSARYAGEGASDRDNLLKLVENIKAKGVDRTTAYYTACIAIVSKYGEYTVHGWMHGDVITEPRGEGGFGYDPMFVPDGYALTLGEIDNEVKKGISHRGKALRLAKPIIKLLGSTS